MDSNELPVVEQVASLTEAASPSTTFYKQVAGNLLAQLHANFITCVILGERFDSQTKKQVRDFALKIASSMGE